MSTERYLGQDYYYVGYSDMRIQRFENMIPLSHGVSYNSFLIKDEKTCLMDTVDSSILLNFIENVRAALAGRSLDYLIVHHMEPDHCAGIVEIMHLYPEAKILGNAKTFTFLQQFRGENFADRQILVNDNDTLSLGKHQLRFCAAPLVHWPEVFFTLDESTGTLFSSDAFGSFNYLSGNMYSDQVNYDEYWLAEARRYYTNIVGKQGASVQKVLGKLASAELRQIFPLHGVLHREPSCIAKLMKLYDLWSRFEAEENGVVFLYSSMYGNMEECCVKLAHMLDERGVAPLRFYDVAHTDESFLLAELFRYSHVVVGAVNHNTQLYHKLASLLEFFVQTGLKDRRFALLVSKSWGGQAGKQALELLSSMKGFTQIGETFEILSALRPEQEEELAALADAIASSYKAAN